MNIHEKLPAPNIAGDIAKKMSFIMFHELDKLDRSDVPEVGLNVAILFFSSILVAVRREDYDTMREDGIKPKKCWDKMAELDKEVIERIEDATKEVHKVLRQQIGT